jgi:hypothetical protein
VEPHHFPTSTSTAAGIAFPRNRTRPPTSDLHHRAPILTRPRRGELTPFVGALAVQSLFICSRRGKSHDPKSRSQSWRRSFKVVGTETHPATCFVTVHESNNVAKVAKTFGGIIGNQVRPRRNSPRVSLPICRMSWTRSRRRSTSFARTRERRPGGSAAR